MCTLADRRFGKRIKPKAPPSLKPFLSVLLGGDTVVAYQVFDTWQTATVDHLPGYGVEALHPCGRDGLALWVWRHKPSCDDAVDAWPFPPSGVLRGPEGETHLWLLNSPASPQTFAGTPFQTGVMPTLGTAPASGSTRRHYSPTELLGGAQASGGMS